MGHTTGGFGIFRTLADPGTTAQPSVYDFFINDAGRVGIGYNAPISTVHIRATKFGASNFAGVFLQGLNPTDAPGIYFSNSANTLSGVIGMAPQRGEYSNDAQAGDTVLAGNRLLLATTTGPSQTPARLTIANDGLVGVGTTAPVTALDVVSNTIFRRTTAVTGVNDLILFSPLDGNVGMELQSGSTGGTPFLDFSNDTVSTFDARLILEQNDVLRLIGAALGIEGVPPATILGWRGNIYRPKLWVQNSDINESRWPAMVIAGDIGLIQFVNSSLSPMADIGTFNSTFSIANRRGGAPITFWTTPSGAGGTPTERLRLLPNGDLVVGAPAVLAPPAAPNGQPGNLSANDIFLRASNRWLSAPSDVRLKDGIATIPNALDRVVQLRGVNFRWKEPRKGESGVRMGVIAQEVEPVFPELVSVSPDGVRYVAYPEMSGALIEAIKELKAQNDALAERVEALEEELSAVKAASGPASE
ncbi:MAG: tail fiber domain-containing protein [Candidatus Omnitrophica bacterium]|nr:tail fiber domain-containing protein [Candidatus Omnitrophota bacterium]